MHWLLSLSARERRVDVIVYECLHYRVPRVCYRVAVAVLSCILTDAREMAVAIINDNKVSLVKRPVVSDPIHVEGLSIQGGDACPPVQTEGKHTSQVTPVAICKETSTQVIR